MYAPSRYLPLVLVACGVLIDSTAGARQPASGAPESFTAAMQTRDQVVMAGSLLVRIDRYTPLDDRANMTNALKFGGYTAFVAALRKSPAAGSVTLDDRKATLRWAREEPAGTGRRIILVTDTPIPVVGRGTPGAKPISGDEVTVIELTVDASGKGAGTMVAAARLKPNEVIGAAIEDDRAERITLTSVTRVTS